MNRKFDTKGLPKPAVYPKNKAHVSGHVAYYIENKASIIPTTVHNCAKNKKAFQSLKH